MSESDKIKVIATNRKANFEYEILKTIEAGLVLTGQEAKSVKIGGMNLTGAFVTFHGVIPLLTNASIAPYKNAGALPDYDPGVSRRLLLRKKQIYDWRAQAEERGLTIVPLKVYIKDRLIKVEIALARGRHKYDKRQALKKKDLKKEIRETRGTP